MNQTMTDKKKDIHETLDRIQECMRWYDWDGAKKVLEEFSDRWRKEGYDQGWYDFLEGDDYRRNSK